MVQIELSVIIPAYNVENSIIKVIEKLMGILNKISTYEIIVVNDGSSDNTLEVLNKFHKNNAFSIITYKKNKGKGHAVKRGIINSKGKFVMYIDGDLDISLEIIKDYIYELKNSDIVIASKDHPNSKVITPTSRKILSKLFNIITKIFTNIRIKDTQVGLKIGDGDLLRKIFQISTIEGFSFDVEFLLIAKLMNAKIHELPVTINLSSGIPKFMRLKLSAQMFKDILKISYKYRILKEYQRKLKKI